MKVLVLSNLFPPHVLGGYEILCGQVVQALAARGHAVTVLTSRHGLAPHEAEAPDDDVHRLLALDRPFGTPAPRARLRRLVTGCENRRRTRAFLGGRRFDVAFVWSQLRLTLGALRAIQAAHLPTLFTFNDEHIAGYVASPFAARPRAALGHAVERWLLPDITLSGIRLDHVTCISRCVRDNLVRAGVPVAHARIIYQGIPVGQFPAKDEPGVLGRPLRLLYVGQLHAYKGVHTLIEAAHRAAAEPALGGVELTVIGTGPADYRSRLMALAAAGPARVHLAGPVPHAELPAAYRAAHVFVFPSAWQEPFGLTHLEAMASGTPVISTADGGHGEFLRDGHNALVFPKEDAAALAHCIGRLGREPTLAWGLARRARAQVAVEFSLARYVSDLETYLREVAGVR